MTQVKQIGLGVVQTAPSPNHKIKSKSEYWAEFIKNSAKYNKMDESKVKEYMDYESRIVRTGTTGQ